tara:strand:- start:2334 stop:3455 length:1122 start_codon:yes stop_codon:yes gene_type:complete
VKKTFVIISSFWVFFGCTETKNKSTNTNYAEYATGFHIENKGSYNILTLKNVIPNSQKSYRYILISDDKKIPKNIDYHGIIRTPLERIIATSTTHIAFLEELNATDILVGFPETKYISSPQLRKKIELGEIVDVGKSQQLNIERVLNLNPDLILSFGVESIDNSLNRFNVKGIPSVFIGEWNEQSPLGRAEWIKVFGALLKKEKKADFLFSEIKRKYNETKNLVTQIKKKPTVLAGAIYQDAWYLPGGNSYLAQLLEDANTNYLWKENNNTGSLVLSVEAVLEKGQDADYWFAPGQHTSYSILNQEHTLYSRFKATQTKKIFTYSLIKGSTGGILFFESGACHPDLVLKDIIHHLYPDLIDSYKPSYFLPLND